MLDFYTCTECGRCQDVCPAYTSGLQLSPKLLMMSLRDELTARGRALRLEGSNGSARAADASALVDRVISEPELWACATCYACDQECPLFIEHISPIVDMRRALVMDGRLDAELQDALANIGRYGNSFGNSPRRRAQWTRSVQPKIKDARQEAVDTLWFVGDYASYSPTLTEITRKTAEVFRVAGLDFGILYEGEQNAGNDVRRVGEEGLFEMLVERNVEALGQCSYQRIVTTDPHSFNALKNEYPQEILDGRAVLHYTELLSELVADGRLTFSHRLRQRVTYHDPCYLGRYNDIYDAPRHLIAATGCTLIEMPRNRDRALCCGAGGGRIWIADGEISERPCEIRIREAMEIPGVEVFLVACPKDVTMYQDAVKTTGHEEDLEVLDIIDLVHAAL
jgi:Fe-S oxidoreductase